MTLTTLQCSILKALERFRFLTCSQLHLLSLGSLSAIRRAVRLLSYFSHPARVIQVLRFPPSARFGKLEFVYSITSYGLIFLHENDPNFQSSRLLAPVWNLFREDYHHRIATISFRIRIEQMLSRNFQIESYANYFEKIASEPFAKPEQATKATFRNGTVFYPDSIFAIRQNQKRGLFAVEIVMGRDQKPILKQIQKHCQALQEGILSEQYRLGKHDYRALFVFKSSNVLKSTRMHLAQKSSFNPFRKHFLFATIADTQRDVLGCWRMVNEEKYLLNCLNGHKAYRLP